MSSDDIVISVRNLTKIYRLFGHPGDRIKQFLSFGLRQYHREFTALNDVSFDIRKGETVGIIGRNGSGKSTLLQLICGILNPTAGAVTVNGRVSALLELGAGFNPEFTGRENVYFQGALMGLSKAEMDQRFDDIAAFADIGEFIDQPVRIYSSGMFVRLAFSTAVYMDPDVLVVDEALAVGDAQFQAKCFRLFERWRQAGKTIVVVSHAIEQIVRSCDYVLLLEQGALLQSGIPGDIAAQYHQLLCSRDGETEPREQYVHAQKDSDNIDCFHLRPFYNPGEVRYGSMAARIVDCLFVDDAGHELSIVPDGRHAFRIKLGIHCERTIRMPILGLSIRTVEGITVFGTNTLQQNSWTSSELTGPATHHVEIALVPHLPAGDYFVSLGLVEGVGTEPAPLDRRIDSLQLRIAGPSQNAGLIAMECEIQLIGQHQGR